MTAFFIGSFRSLGLLHVLLVGWLTLRLASIVWISLCQSASCRSPWKHSIALWSRQNFLKQVQTLGIVVVMLLPQAVHQEMMRSWGWISTSYGSLLFIQGLLLLFLYELLLLLSSSLLSFIHRVAFLAEALGGSTLTLVVKHKNWLLILMLLWSIEWLWVTPNHDGSITVPWARQLMTSKITVKKI